jgi:hypothetical protein
MAEVVDLGGKKRMEDFFALLQREMPKKLQAVAEIMAADAASRAPTPEEEYRTMSEGDGNPEGITNLPPMPTSLTESDPDKRLRFYKLDSMYMQPTVARSYKVEGLVVCVGEIAELNAASVYQWKNVDGSIYSSTYPFWEAIEKGTVGSFYISPVHPQKRDPPTLTPGVGKYDERYFMFKRIDAHHMYGGINIDNYVYQIIIPEIQKLARQS